MLRSDITVSKLWVPFLLVAFVGCAAAVLVVAGNPGNMGICGVCFLRDVSGSLSLFSGEGPKIVRPEVTGVMLGAMLWMMIRGKFHGRSGSHAATKFFVAIWMAFGALVFLGCPFRMLQRIGGGDLNAVVGAVGFVAGVGIGVFFESRGYKAGKTSVAPTPVGIVGPLTTTIVLVLFICGLLAGPGVGDPTGPPHAVWYLALGIAVLAGGAMSATGFCAITAARQVFLKRKRMLVAAGILIGAYALVVVLAGRFKFGFADQPAAHADAVWNILSLTLVGLTGVLAGGCPVRQMVIAGEGNGDAFVTVCGLLVGSALAHNLGIVSSSAGTTPAGRIAVLTGLGMMIAYAAAISWLSTPKK